MDNRTYVARPINDIGLFNTQVDIVLPFHGQYDKVTDLLESLFRLTRSNHYKVYVVDDCSSNPQFIRNIEQNSTKNAEKTRQPKVVYTIRNEEQKGYVESCKAGFDAGESPYVCFLHSDCLIKDSGWLKSMGESLLKLKSQNVRVVSPMTNNHVNGDDHQKGELFKKDADRIIQEDSFLSLYCFMCHRDLFKNIDGFLKPYCFGEFTDQEFANRLKFYGFKQAVCGSSWIHHDGEVTIKEVMRRDPNSYLKEIIEENRKTCIEDMRKYIRVQK